MSRLLKEPLAQFLLLGALLFALFGAFGSQRGTADPSLVVTVADTTRIVATWQRQWGRPPSDSELAHLVEQHIREEVLYREALAMGLDKNDTIVRRRLVQKLEFLSEDLAVPGAPSPEAVSAFFAEEGEEYRVPARVSFSHVYLSRDRRGEDAEADAEALLAELKRTTPDRAPSKGDRFMLQYDFVEKSESEIARDFGSDFAAAVVRLEVGGWEGPIASGYGLHLVRLSDSLKSRLPELSEVENRVRNDLVTRLRREANENFYLDLRARYTVTFEKPAEETVEDRPGG